MGITKEQEKEFEKYFDENINKPLEFESLLECGEITKSQRNSSFSADEAFDKGFLEKAKEQDIQPLVDFINAKD